MAKNYEQMTRLELLAEVARLRKQCVQGVSVESLQHDLETHREELAAQQYHLRNTQELLEASRDAYAELYDFAPIAYLTLDPNGVILSINLTGCALLERERIRVHGLPFYGFVSKDSRNGFLEHMRRCRLGQRHVESELVLQLPSGRSVPMLLQSRPDSLPPKAFRTVLLDLTERKQSEQEVHDLNASLERRVQERTLELERANRDLKREVEQRVIAEAALQDAHRRKDDFLAMLGHELRNPLAPLCNAAELLSLKAAENSEIQDICRIMERQSHHMMRIIDDLLDVSRITHGKISLRLETLDWCSVIRDVVRDFSTTLAKDIAVQLNLPPAPVWLQADATRLTQVLQNLLHNSVKFTPPGGQVVIDLTRDEQANAALLSVRDTGVGIDPQLLDVVFDAFRQADQSLHRSHGGLGLGLALVKGLISLHGGKVSAHSEGIGHGTEMRVWLPVVASPQRHVVLPASVPAPVTPKSRHRVLVIDDRRDSLRMLQALLSNLGQEVYTAESGEQGLEMASLVHPEIVFSDIGLPGIDGYAVAQQLRSHPELSETYLVAVTGYGQPEDERRSYEAGFNRHFRKPITLDALRSLLGSFQREWVSST
jgi:PAS domain S-box-containing protein